MLVRVLGWAGPNGYPIPARCLTFLSITDLNIRYTRNTWNKLIYLEIPESKYGTRKYLIKDFNTSTRPKPARYLTFFFNTQQNSS